MTEVVSFEVDTKQLDSAIQKWEELGAATNDAADSVEALNAAQAETAKQAKALAEEEKRLMKAIEEANDPAVVEDLNKALAKTQAEMLKVAKAADNAGDALADVGDGAAAGAKAAGGALKKLGSDLNKVGDAAGAATADLGLVDGVLGKLDEATGGAASGFITMAKSFGAAGGALGGLSGGASGASKAFNLLKVAIASTGIGLLVIALGAIVAYFTSTREGANKLSAALSGIGGVVSTATKAFGEFGGKIIDAFSNPKQALLDLANLVKENLINRFTAFGTILDGIINLDFKKIANGVLQASSGVVDVIGKVSKIGESVADTYNKGADAAAKLLKIEQDLLPAAKAQLELDKGRIGGLETLSGVTTILNEDIKKFGSFEAAQADRFEQRLKAINGASKVAQDSYGKTIGVIKQQVSALQQVAALDETSAEKRQAAADAVNELKALEGEYYEKKQSLEAQTRAIIAEREAADKAAEEARIAKIAEVEERIRTFREETATLSTEAEAESINKSFAKRMEKLNEEAAAKRDALLKEELDAVATEEQKVAFASAKTDRLLAFDKKLEGDRKKIDEERIAAEKAATDKILADKLAAVDKAANAETLGLKQSLADGLLTQEQYADAEVALKKKTIEDKLLLTEAGTDAEIELLKELADIKTAENEKEVAAAEKLKQDREASSVATLQLAADTLSQLGDVLSEISSRQTAEIEERAAAEIAAVDEQVAAGLLTEEQAEKQRLEIQRKADAETRAIKKKQFETEKAIAITTAIITGALAALQAFSAVIGIIPVGPVLAPIAAGIAAAFAAVQIGLIASAPPPKFAKGVIDLQGKGTGTSDSIPAFLSAGESVMTSRETGMFRPTLESIRMGKIDPELLNYVATGGAVAKYAVQDNAKVIDKLGELKNAIERKDSVSVQVDERGFAVFSQNITGKKEYLDKRYQSA